MQIIGNPKASLQPGNFSARIDNGQLCLPSRLVALLGRSDVTTAEEFVAHLRCFPSSVATYLEWSPQEVSAASEALVNYLHSHVDEQLLRPPSTPKRSFGARPPRR
jgi:hypothetical protein